MSLMMHTTVVNKAFNAIKYHVNPSTCVGGLYIKGKLKNVVYGWSTLTCDRGAVA